MPEPSGPLTQAATVEAVLHAELRGLRLEEQQALTWLLQTAAPNPRCGHMLILCPDGLGCFACLAKAGELPDA